MLRRLSVVSIMVLSLAAAACVGNSDDTSSPACGTYAALGTTTSGTTVHVSAACGTSAPDAKRDGSPTSPYATISAGLAAAPAGATVLVDAGTYAENLVITKSVDLRGAGPAATLVTPLAGAAGVFIDAATVRLEGVTIRDAEIAGVQIASGEVTLSGCQILGSRKDAGGAFGFGVVAAAGASVAIAGSAVNDSQGIGVLLSGAAGSILDSTISRNAGGGVRLEQTQGDVRIERNEVLGNTRFGVWLLSARGIVVQNRVASTAAEGGDMGDGVIATELVDAQGVSAGPSHLELSGDNTVEGNARVGVLLAGEVLGIVVQNRVASNGRAGVWLQEAAGSSGSLTVENNDVIENVGVGIGLTGAAIAAVKGNRVSGTSEAAMLDAAGGSFVIGDGVALLAGATAAVDSNVCTRNARLGMIADAVGAGTTLVGNTVTDNDAYGIVVQNLPSPIDTSSNTLSGNTTSDLHEPAPEAALATTPGRLDTD